jgi:CubicO group peptidase (beta-lactamase class C family)
MQNSVPRPRVLMCTMWRALTLTSALTLCAASPTPLAAQSRAAQVRELDAYITKGVRDWEIPGLTVSVVRNDSVVFSKGYGVRRLGAEGAVDDQTQFGIMSTTKAFTAMAMAMLVDDGKLAWDDPITKHLPEFQFSDPFLTREATVKDLLTHNIGLDNADMLWARGDMKRPEILRRVRQIPIAYSLRSSFIYQNVMYGTAGEVIARVSGMSWDDFIRTRIFAPLGMTHSYTTYAEMHRVAGANQSEPHFRIRDTIRVIADETVDELPAAGSIWSSAADMAKWVRFMLDSGRVNGRRLVSEEGYRELLKPQTMVTPDGFYPTASVTRPHWTTYGLGWFQQDFRGRFLSFHTGSLDGRTAMVGIMPEARTGIFIAGNLDHAEFRHALLLQAMDIFAGTNGGAPRNWSVEFQTLYRGLHDAGAAAMAAADSRRVTGTKPSLPMPAYAGTYVNPAWGSLIIAGEGDALRMQIGTSPTLRGPLQHWNYDTFRATLGDGRSGSNSLTFQLNGAGKVSTVVLDGSENHVFTRVDDVRK